MVASLRHGPDFKKALSTLQRLHQEAREEPQVPTYSYKHQQWEARSSYSTWWNLQGSCMVDFLSFRKSRRRCTKYWVNGATCCLQFLERFFGKRLSWIQFVLLRIDRLQLTAVYCNRRACVKTTPQKTRFRSVRIYNICNTSKKWVCGNIDNKWSDDTNAQSDKHNNIFNVASNLKHVETHENNYWRLVSAVEWTAAELPCLQCLFWVVCVVLVCCTVPCLHDWSHCGSSLCFVRLIVIAMSHAHVEWRSLRPLHLSHFPSLHSLYLPALPTAFHLPLPWCRVPQPRALPLRSWVSADKKNSSTKQNQEDLPQHAHLQELYLFEKEDGLILNQELNLIKRTQWQKDYTLFFDTENYLEKKVARSKSGDRKMIFGTNLSIPNIGLMKCGRAKWQEAKATRKDFNIVLSRQDKKFFTSELFKVIQNAIPLILHC